MSDAVFGILSRIGVGDGIGEHRGVFGVFVFDANVDESRADDGFDFEF